MRNIFASRWTKASAAAAIAALGLVSATLPLIAGITPRLNGLLPASMMMLEELHPMSFSRPLGAALVTAFLFLAASSGANSYDRYDRERERERDHWRHEQRHEAYRHE